MSAIQHSETEKQLAAGSSYLKEIERQPMIRKLCRQLEVLELLPLEQSMRSTSI